MRDGDDGYVMPKMGGPPDDSCSDQADGEATARRSRRLRDAEEGAAISAGIALTSGGMSVRYRWSAVAGAAGDYYAVNVYGGTILRELFADGFESGNAGAWR